MGVLTFKLTMRPMPIVSDGARWATRRTVDPSGLRQLRCASPEIRTSNGRDGSFATGPGQQHVQPRLLCAESDGRPSKCDPLLWASFGLMHCKNWRPCLSPVGDVPRGSLEAPAKCDILPYVSAGMSSPSPRWSTWRGRQICSTSRRPQNKNGPRFSTRHHIIFRTVYLPHSISEFGRIVRHCAARSRLASARRKPSH